MPRGYPDYQSSREPAIALQTVWEDDFEAAVLRWVAGTTVGGTLPVLSTVQSWNGIQSVYFVSAAVAGEEPYIARALPLTRLGKVSIGCFMLLNITTPGYQRFRLSIYDGVNISRADLWLDEQARIAYIITPAGTIPVATFCFNTAPLRAWTPVKLVVDTVTDRYVRLLIGEQEIDLSAHALVLVGPTTDKALWVSINLVDVGGAGMWAYVDDFILTQNEP